MASVPLTHAGACAGLWYSRIHRPRGDSSAGLREASGLVGDGGHPLRVPRWLCSLFRGHSRRAFWTSCQWWAAEIIERIRANSNIIIHFKMYSIQYIYLYKTELLFKSVCNFRFSISSCCYVMLAKVIRIFKEQRSSFSGSWQMKSFGQRETMLYRLMLRTWSPVYSNKILWTD